ncbi:MAG: NAD-dependent isocitrate dehydrogenase [Deltaproteobacteria bacterium]|nr:NAD-dependent isocitrate dehydrogenase [Deltaproteobacteria bacterium]
MSATRTVTLVPGDGGGPALADAVVRIFAAAAVPIAWERVAAGDEALRRQGSAIPAELVGSVLRTRVALKGHLAARLGEARENPNVALRKMLDLYANVRSVQSFPGRASRYPGLDLVVVRESTEGEYAGLEHRVVPGVVESIKVTTADACTRIARFAFAHAAAAGRAKVTAVHKANIMKRADGLFLDCCRAVAREHPAIAFQELIVDNACMQLVMNPYQFDVMVMQNFYGDLVSDLCAGLAGGRGVVPSASFGDDLAVFEAIYDDASAVAAPDAVNPMTLLVSALAMLRHLGLAAQADRITAATSAVLAEGTRVTRDLGGTAGTTAMADAIVARL